MMPIMDERRVVYSLKAPGRSAPGFRLPGRDFPGVDEHLVAGEVTRDEVIGGRRVVASPAHEPHATQHTELDYVVRALVAPGFSTAADLLTRHDRESDFASDVCVFKAGVDPATGSRYLEEIAFEVVSEQDEGDVTEKAFRMYRRGVRRIFTVWVKNGRVREWSSEIQGWRLLAVDARIEDPCFVAPLAVSSLLDAAAADNAVVEALAAKGNPVIRKREAAAVATGKGEGRAEGFAESILEVLEARGVAVSLAERQEILDCHDVDRLRRWLRRAALASSIAEAVSEP